MRVKVGDTWYDAEDTPIMVELTQTDKSNISNMKTDAFKYCSYPDEQDPKVIEAWMKE